MLAAQLSVCPGSTEPCFPAPALQLFINQCGSAVCNPGIQETEAGQFKIILGLVVRLRPANLNFMRTWVGGATTPCSS